MKQDYLKKLVLVSFRIEHKLNLKEQRTNNINKMASLARKGLKDTEEFKILNRKFKQPTVIDFGDELNELKSLVNKLKKYNWE